MRLIRQKSVGLTQLFVQCVEDRCAGYGLELISPRDPAVRGSQVSFTFSGDGYALMQALIAENIIGDFRRPNNLRFGFAPLYNTYGEVVRAVDVLEDILSSGRWNTDEFTTRKAVT